MEPSSVAFHFDVMCPFAYQTSLWIREVRRQTGLRIDWRFFSLEEVNRVEGGKHPWQREWSYGWSMMRIGALLRRQDMALLDEWYLRAATALHVDGHRPHDPAVARHIIGEMGLDPGLVDEAIADRTTHDDIHRDHDAVIAAGGYGVPTLCFPGSASSADSDDRAGDTDSTADTYLFGPVILDPPTGEAALRLWSAVTAWLEFPHLYELQRPKTAADAHYIAESFRPYLEARDWVSINRGEKIDFGAYDPKNASNPSGSPQLP